LAGCDTAPNIELYNATGRPLVLGIGKGSEGTKAVRLESGAATRVWNIYGPAFRLEFDSCERRYDLPYMELNEPWPLRDAEGLPYPDPAHDYPYPVKVELGADDVLHLPPREAKGVAAPPTEAAPRQAHGYPLKPLSKTCR
jgi:hypothetical protein